MSEPVTLPRWLVGVVTSLTVAVVLGGGTQAVLVYTQLQRG